MVESPCPGSSRSSARDTVATPRPATPPAGMESPEPYTILSRLSSQTFPVPTKKQTLQNPSVPLSTLKCPSAPLPTLQNPVFPCKLSRTPVSPRWRRPLCRLRKCELIVDNSVLPKCDPICKCNNIFIFYFGISKGCNQLGRNDVKLPADVIRYLYRSHFSHWT